MQCAPTHTCLPYPINNDLLKVWVKIYRLISNDALISLCWRTRKLLIASQHIHKSPILVCKIRFTFPWACSTLHITHKINWNIIAYLFDVVLSICITLFVQALKLFLISFNPSLLNIFQKYRPCQTNTFKIFNIFRKCFTISTINHNCPCFHNNISCLPWMNKHFTLGL